MKIKNDAECYQTIEKLRGINREIEGKKREFRKLENDVIEYYGATLESEEVIYKSKELYQTIYKHTDDSPHEG